MDVVQPVIGGVVIAMVDIPTVPLSGEAEAHHFGPGPVTAFAALNLLRRVLVVGLVALMLVHGLSGIAMGTVEGT